MDPQTCGGRSSRLLMGLPGNGWHNPEFTQKLRCAGGIRVLRGSGQVAQVVERSPEKAGVGGSTPSLATISFSDLANQPENFTPVI